MNNFELYLEKFNKMQDFMIYDLQKATVYGTANFLVAMGLFNYVEVIGGFYYPKSISNSDQPAKRFNFVFNKLFPKEYKSFREDLNKVVLQTSIKKRKTNTVYDILRSGLTHEYLVKTSSKNVKKTDCFVYFHIYGVNQNDFCTYYASIRNRKCGLEVHKGEEKNYHLNIFLPKLIDDFNISFENYKKKLNTKAHYKTRFMKRCEELNFIGFI